MLLPNRRRAEKRPPDAQLLDRDLHRLIGDYSALIYHVAYGILHDRGLAEDVVQETMIKAWEYQSSFRGDSSVKTWLVRIGRNAAIDTLRRRRDRVTARGDVPEMADQNASTDTERVAQGRAVVSELAAALDTLDELSRTIIVLREVDSMSYQDISEALEVPVSTVKTRLLRARRALQETLSEQQDG